MERGGEYVPEDYCSSLCQMTRVSFCKYRVLMCSSLNKDGYMLNRYNYCEKMKKQEQT